MSLLPPLPRHQDSHSRWTDFRGSGHTIQPLRQAAISCDQIDPAVATFVTHFGLGISDLIELYRNPNWTGHAYGGNKWAEVTVAIEDVYQSLRLGGDTETCRRRLQAISAIEHNNGSVSEKLDG